MDRMPSDVNADTSRQVSRWPQLTVEVRTSAIEPILACCGSWQGLISLEWKVEKVEVGRAEG